MRSIVRRARSKSPFRRRRSTRELINDIDDSRVEYCKYVERQQSFPVEPSAVEVVFREPDPPFSFLKKTETTETAESGDTVPELPDVKTTSTASSTKSSKEVTPLAMSDSQKRKQFRKRFMKKQQLMEDDKDSLNDFKSQEEARSKEEGDMPAFDPPGRRCAPFNLPNSRGSFRRGRSPSRRGRSQTSSEPAQSQGREMAQSSQERFPPIPEEGDSEHFSTIKMARTRSIKKKIICPLDSAQSESTAVHRIRSSFTRDSCSRKCLPKTSSDVKSQYLDKPDSVLVSRDSSQVSELSTPAVRRQQSVGEDSVAEVKRVLTRIENDLTDVTKSGRKIPRDAILRTLLQVVDKLETDEEREAVHRELESWVESREREESEVGATDHAVFKGRSSKNDRQSREGREEGLYAAEWRKNNKKLEREAHARFGYDDEDEDTEFTDWIAELEDQASVDSSYESRATIEFLPDIFGLGRFFSGPSEPKTKGRKDRREKRRGRGWMYEDDYDDDEEDDWTRGTGRETRDKDSSTHKYSSSGTREPVEEWSTDSHSSENPESRFSSFMSEPLSWWRYSGNEAPSSRQTGRAPARSSAPESPRSKSKMLNVSSTSELDEDMSVGSINSSQFVKAEPVGQRERSRDDTEVNVYTVSYVRTPSSTDSSAHYMLSDEENSPARRRSKSAHSPRQRLGQRMQL